MASRITCNTKLKGINITVESEDSTECLEQLSHAMRLINDDYRDGASFPAETTDDTKVTHKATPEPVEEEAPKAPSKRRKASGKAAAKVENEAPKARFKDGTKFPGEAGAERNFDHIKVAQEYLDNGHFLVKEKSEIPGPKFVGQFDAELDAFRVMPADEKVEGRFRSFLESELAKESAEEDGDAAEEAPAPKAKKEKPEHIDRAGEMEGEEAFHPEITTAQEYMERCREAMKSYAAAHGQKEAQVAVRAIMARNGIERFPDAKKEQWGKIVYDMETLTNA